MSNERLELMVTKAFKIAEDFSHRYVTLEHVLCVILEDQDVIDVIVELGGDPLNISDHTYAYCHTELEEIKMVDVFACIVLSIYSSAPSAQLGVSRLNEGA